MAHRKGRMKDISAQASLWMSYAYMVTNTLDHFRQAALKRNDNMLLLYKVPESLLANGTVN